MAYPTPAVTVTTAATFIPEIWSDEIIAAYKKNLVLANIVMKMNFKGKKGDTIHIPAPTRGSASAKAAEAAVTLIAATESEVNVSINKHYEYSRLIEDIAEVQALNSMRNFYTSDAGYALAKHAQSAKAQIIFWSVADAFLLDAAQATQLGAKGRYWVSRSLLELAQLHEDAGQIDEAQRSYQLILDYEMYIIKLEIVKLDELVSTRTEADPKIPESLSTSERLFSI